MICAVGLGGQGRRVSRDELDPDRLDGLFELGIDEVSWRKQHRYLTLVSDHRRGCVVWGTAGAGQAAADEFFTELEPARCDEVKAISLDMGPGYAKSGECPRICVGRSELESHAYEEPHEDRGDRGPRRR